MNLELKTPRQYAEEILADEEPYALKVAGELEEAEGDKALLDEAATCLKDDSAYLVDIAKSILAADEQARGNAEKLREAVEAIMELSRGAREEMSTAHYPVAEIGMGALDDIICIAKAALASPPRNCDRFATAEEADVAYRRFCSREIAKIPLDAVDYSKRVQIPTKNKWLFAPAPEKEGGKDEQK